MSIIFFLLFIQLQVIISTLYLDTYKLVLIYILHLKQIFLLFLLSAYKHFCVHNLCLKPKKIYFKVKLRYVRKKYVDSVIYCKNVKTAIKKFDRKYNLYTRKL